MRLMNVRIGLGVFCALVAAIGCTPQHHITGEPMVFRVNPVSGEVTDRDVASTANDSPLGTIPHKDEIITLVLNNVFVKHLETLAEHRLLVYAEVYDDGQDDPTTAVSKVLFDQSGQ